MRYDLLIIAAIICATFLTMLKECKPDPEETKRQNELMYSLLASGKINPCN